MRAICPGAQGANLSGGRRGGEKLVEKLEDVVKLQTEAIKQIKIDKITVWDTGNAEKGSTTANFMSSFVKSLPALHDVAEMAGVDYKRAWYLIVQRGMSPDQALQN